MGWVEKTTGFRFGCWIFPMPSSNEEVLHLRDHLLPALLSILEFSKE